MWTKMHLIEGKNFRINFNASVQQVTYGPKIFQYKNKEWLGNVYGVPFRYKKHDAQVTG